MQLKPLNEQVVVVVGASSGIGRETALRLGKAGAKVVVSARDQQGLDTLVNEISEQGGQAISVVADVSDFAQVKSVADRAVAEYGRLDTWAHVAAVEIYAKFEDTTPEEFKQLIEINLMGQVYGAKAALPYIREQGRGALIHVSSVEGVVSLPYQSAYAASKHGIIGFADSLRLELKHENVPISVSTILPASINTPIFDKALTRLGVRPMGVPPVYEPGLVADMIVYAAAHPSRELIAGGAGKILAITKKLSPSLMDVFLMLTAFRGQKTKQPKPDSAPNNLFEPVEGLAQSKGNLKAKNFSLYDLFEKIISSKRPQLD